MKSELYSGLFFLGEQGFMLENILLEIAIFF